MTRLKNATLNIIITLSYFLVVFLIGKLINIYSITWGLIFITWGYLLSIIFIIFANYDRIKIKYFNITPKELSDFHNKNKTRNNSLKITNFIRKINALKFWEALLLIIIIQIVVYIILYLIFGSTPQYFFIIF
jgi:hypothetical protein